MPEETKVEDIISNASPEPEVKEAEDIKAEEKVDDSELKGKEEEKKDDGPGFVKNLMTKLGVGKVDDEIGEAAQEDDKTETEGEDIPDAFTEAALKNGWAEKDITEFASEHSDEELVEMIPYLAAEDKPESEEKTQEAASKKEQETGKESEAKKDESEAIKELRKEIDGLKRGREKDDVVRKTQEQVALMETVDKAFDDANEKVGIFGKSKELPRFPAGPKKGQLIPTSPAFKARSEVWDIATTFVEAGNSPKDAMTKALTWYKGEHLDKEVERKYIEKLKRSEKKLSAKRTGKETQKTYASEEDRGAAVVKELARKAGVKGELDD